MRAINDSISYETYGILVCICAKCMIYMSKGVVASRVERKRARDCACCCVIYTLYTLRIQFMQILLQLNWFGSEPDRVRARARR